MSPRFIIYYNEGSIYAQRSLSSLNGFDFTFQFKMLLTLSPLDSFLKRII